MAWRRAGPLAVALALLFAQSLGALHRAAHDDAGTRQRGSAAAAEAARPSLKDAGRAGLERLLPQHGSAEECAAFDQACGSALAPQWPAAVPPAIAHAALPARSDPFDASGRSRPFFARAPPARPAPI